MGGKRYFWDVGADTARLSANAVRSDCVMGCASSTPAKVGPNVAAAPEEPSQAPRRQGSSLQNRPVSQRGDDGYAAFISHVKAEASMEARFLQTELEGLFQKRVFLDSDDLRDLRKLQDHVRECDCFILVQSASVLTRPYCLLELCVAIDANKPIVGVSLTGAYAYDFAAAQTLLAHLDTQLAPADSEKGRGLSSDERRPGSAGLPLAAPRAARSCSTRAPPRCCAPTAST